MMDQSDDVEELERQRTKIIEYVAKLIQIDPNVSDVHITAGSPPVVRINGKLHAVGDKRLLPEDTKRLASSLMPSDELRRRLLSGNLRQVDFAFGVAGVSRLRVNVFLQRGTVAIVMRQVPNRVPEIDQLDLPPVLHDLCQRERGMILVTGVTGSGKSTTLAAMINEINKTARKNIITIEDPIEYLHPNKKSLVRQREVGSDTDSFADALRGALRQDPDIILVGEMRDTETISIAIKAAETGHLVFSTLHTTSAPSTINRIIDSFPPHQQHQVRLQIAENLVAVISQRLLPRKDGAGRIPAVEVLIATNRVADYIRHPDKTPLLDDAIAEGREAYGMQSFDQHLLELLRHDRLEVRTALLAATRPADLTLRLQTEGIATAELEEIMAEERAEPAGGTLPAAGARPARPALSPGVSRGAALPAEAGFPAPPARAVPGARGSAAPAKVEPETDKAARPVLKAPTFAPEETRRISRSMVKPPTPRPAPSAGEDEQLDADFLDLIER